MESTLGTAGLNNLYTDGMFVPRTLSAVIADLYKKYRIKMLPVQLVTTYLLKVEVPSKALSS